MTNKFLMIKLNGTPFIYRESHDFVKKRSLFSMREVNYVNGDAFRCDMNSNKNKFPLKTNLSYVL